MNSSKNKLNNKINWLKIIYPNTHEVWKSRRQKVCVVKNKQEKKLKMRSNICLVRKNNKRLAIVLYWAVYLVKESSHCPVFSSFFFF